VIDKLRVTAGEVRGTEVRLRSVLRGLVPEANLKSGSVFNDLLIRGLAYGAVLLEKEADEVRSRMSLSLLAARTDNAASIALDDLVSNWLIERKQGGLATGEIFLATSSTAGYAIPSNIRFTVPGGVAFVLADSSSDIAVSVDDLLEDTSVTPSRYLYRLSVISASSGLGGSLPPSTFTSSFQPANFSSAFSVSPMSAVAAIETNSALVDRAKDSLSLRGLSTVRSIKATLEDEELPTLYNVEVVSSGDSEMQRDLVTIGDYATTVHSLGYANILPYLAVISDPVTAQLSTTATSVQLPSQYAITGLRSVKDSSNNELPRVSQTSPGKYAVRDGSVISVVSELPPAYVEVNPASYSANTHNRVGDSIGLKTVDLAPVKYSVALYTAAEFGTINTLVSSEDNRIATGNVATVLPNLVEVYLKLCYVRNTNSPVAISTSRIQQVAVSYINSYVGSLTVSGIVSHLIQNLYQYVASIDLSASTFMYALNLPDGTVAPYSTTSLFSVEDVSKLLDPEQSFTRDSLLDMQISDRTCQFYAGTHTVSVVEAV
jgi:hypothetical protein